MNERCTECPNIRRFIRIHPDSMDEETVAKLNQFGNSAANCTGVIPTGETARGGVLGLKQVPVYNCGVGDIND